MNRRSIILLLGLIGLLLIIGGGIILAYKIFNPSPSPKRLQASIKDCETTIDSLQVIITGNQDEIGDLEKTIIVLSTRLKKVEKDLHIIKETIQQRKEMVQTLRDKLRSCRTDTCRYYSSILKHMKVGDMEGNYYRINLKSIVNKETLYFEPAEYSLKNRRRDYQDSLDELYKDINLLIDNDISFKIFTIGSADSLPLKKGRKLPQREGLKLYVHRNEGNNTYAKSTTMVTIPQYYQNQHLPDLRGTELKKILQNQDRTLEIELLQGAVTAQENHRDRNTSFILYVKDWDFLYKN